MQRGMAYTTEESSDSVNMLAVTVPGGDVSVSLQGRPVSVA